MSIKSGMTVFALACLAFDAGSASATTYKYSLFDAPGAPITLALGVNDAGQIVGGTGAAGYQRSGNDYQKIAFPNANSSQAYGICDVGRVAGFYSDSNGFHGFVEVLGSYTAINAPDATNTFSFGVNVPGQVVGSFTSSSGANYGYVYYSGGYKTISVPGAVVARNSGTQAHGINIKGQIVGFYNQGVDPTTNKNLIGGFLDKNGSITTFSVPGAIATEANGINDAGDIVGTYELPSGAGYGFVYSHGAYSTLSVPGASITEAQGINNAGEVVGFVIMSGHINGFVAKPQ